MSAGNAGGERTVDLCGAIAVAAQAHQFQVYRGLGERSDEPYIRHPLRVMDAVPEQAKSVAVLHDVLEDTGTPLPLWLLTEAEVRALRLLTRDKAATTYADYIQRIAEADGEAGELARAVKDADLRDNLSNLPEGAFADAAATRLRTRYTAALRIIAPLAARDAATPTEAP